MTGPPSQCLVTFITKEMISANTTAAKKDGCHSLQKKKLKYGTMYSEQQDKPTTLQRKYVKRQL